MGRGSGFLSFGVFPPSRPVEGWVGIVNGALMPDDSTLAFVVSASLPVSAYKAGIVPVAFILSKLHVGSFPAFAASPAGEDTVLVSLVVVGVAVVCGVGVVVRRLVTVVKDAFPLDSVVVGDPGFPDEDGVVV